MDHATSTFGTSLSDMGATSVGSATATVAPAIDRVHLHHQTLGRADLAIEVLGLYLEHARTCRDRLAAAGDDKSWREAAHSLKGTARAIGAFAVGDAAFAMEAMGGDARSDGRDGALELLDRRLAAAEADIAAILAELEAVVRV